MFTLEKNKWQIDPQYLSIRCVRVIWDRDPSPNKELATAQIGWLFHMFHPKSIYRDVRDSLRDYTIRQATFPKEHAEWDIEADEEMMICRTWYESKLKDTPIWDSVRAIEQAVYQLNDMLRDPKVSAYEKKSALDTVSNEIQPKLKKLKEQAERDEVLDIDIKISKDIKYGERTENAERGKTMPPGANYANATPATHDKLADLKPPIPHSD